MCTLSFSPTRNGLLLAMNRDESLARAAALPPQVAAAGAVRAAFPSEPSGGTWLAASDSGLILALLNRNGEERPKLRSRGVLIPSLIAANSLDEIEGRLHLSGAAGMLPFTLLAFDNVRCDILEAVWDGERFTTIRAPWAPRHWFSSGLSDKAAAAIRGRTCSVFREHFAASPENFRELHRSHSPGAGPYSICVHRPGVGSVSYSEIVIEGGSISFSYAPGAPCERHALQSLTMSLASAGRPAA